MLIIWLTWFGGSEWHGERQELLEKATVVSPSEKDEYWKQPFFFISTLIKPVSDSPRVLGRTDSLQWILIWTCLVIWPFSAHPVVKWWITAFRWSWGWRPFLGQRVARVPGTVLRARCSGDSTADAPTARAAGRGGCLSSFVGEGTGTPTGHVVGPGSPASCVLRLRLA